MNPDDLTTQELAQQILAWIDHTKQSTDRLSAPHYIVDCFSSFIGDLETLCKEQLQEEIPMHPNESITKLEEANHRAVDASMLLGEK